MTRHDRLHVLTTILEHGLVATFHDEDAAKAEAMALGLVKGGARVVELLHRSATAFDAFGAIGAKLRREHPEVVFGVGSIVDAPTAALFLARGADFVVGPNFNPRVARLCNRRKVAYLPGCSTVSEISDAEELGCEIVKLFPSSALNGPEFVRSLHGPMPWSRVMPTGNGVAYSEASIRDWFAAGACAIGMGSLADGSARDATAITARTQQALAWIAAARRR